MKIIFTPEAYKKFRAYVHGIGHEISGFGKVEKLEDSFRITDVKIFPQVVSGVHTVMDAQNLAAFWDELMVAGEDIGQWKLWWHSHVFMAAMFSQTDHETIDEFDTEMPEENWILSIVTNKYGKSLAKADIFQPIRCTLNDLPIDIEVGDVALTEDIEKEIKEKVTILRPQHNDPDDRINFAGKRMSLFQKPGLTELEKERLRRIFPHRMLGPFGTEQEIIDIEPLDS